MSVYKRDPVSNQLIEMKQVWCSTKFCKGFMWKPFNDPEPFVCYAHEKQLDLPFGGIDVNEMVKA